MSSSKWVVHKFGGTSLGDADCFERVVHILGDVRPPCAVVVSAMAGVTDELLKMMDACRNRDPAHEKILVATKAKYVAVAQKRLKGEERKTFLARMDQDERDIRDLLRAMWLSKGTAQESRDYLVGYGELWSAVLLAAVLRGQGRAALPWDAREVLVVDETPAGPLVDWKESRRRTRHKIDESPRSLPVITGFVASRRDGSPTTLRRNGSDFSASIFANLLDAESVTIWTDVDGVLSADPRRVPEAVVLDELSYEEAMELAYFGAKVVHPSTMAPVVEKGIPIWIRNTFRPALPGSRIGKRVSPKAAPSDGPKIVKGFSTVDGLAVVNVEGGGMMGVPGIAHRLFGALKDVGVSVILISQASSEHSICFAVPGNQGKLACDTVKKEFFRELEHRQIERVDVLEGCTILAAVGEDMAEVPGVAARFFSALGNAGVNIRAIAQGSSERNISAVIDGSESSRALRAVHAGFYLSDLTLSVGLIGPGLIGRTVLEQLAARAPSLREDTHVDLRVRGIANSTQMLLKDSSIDIARWSSEFGASAREVDLEQFVNHLQADHIPHTVIVDCSSSEKIARLYPRWLARGIHVVTPNKKANSSELKLYQAIRQSPRGRYFYEATVGAGLPVISTLRDLIHTGDRVLGIEGVLSGTLSYIFNSFKDGTRFSAIVKEARDKGYTEPDPRDDLSGMDVARKLIILAREMGLALEMEDIEVKNLVPENLRRGSSVEKFLEGLPRADDAFEDLRRRAKGGALRYVGVIHAEKKPRAEVTLRTYPSEHPFARLSGSDNIIAFTTERYRAQPLIVQGPGAGPAVTAGGVFADLLRLAAQLGAKL